MYCFFAANFIGFGDSTRGLIGKSANPVLYTDLSPSIVRKMYVLEFCINIINNKE